MRPILGWDLRETRTQVDGAACQVLFASKSVGKRRDFGVEPGSTIHLVRQERFNMIEKQT